jgi:hypothetical protein
VYLNLDKTRYDFVNPSYMLGFFVEIFLYVLLSMGKSTTKLKPITVLVITMIVLTFAFITIVRNSSV